jgi:hypothetical protein
LLDDVEPPPDWQGGHYTYTAGVWARTAQGEAARIAKLNQFKAESVVAIDNAVAAVYGRFTRFENEYVPRKDQAQAFKDGGYVGDVPPKVAEFATPAGLEAQVATDLILSQAAQLEDALDALSALRMRKYEVQRAATDEVARAAHADILMRVEAIDKALT